MVEALPFPDRGLQVVTIITFILLLCAVGFTLTAAWLRAANVRDQRRWARLESLWEPVILGVLTGELSDTELRARVARRDHSRFAAFLLRYARQLKGTERETVLRLAAPYLDEISHDLRRRSPELRARALQTLGELSVAEYSREFLGALEDPSPLVAMTAAQALARHYDPAYADRLLKVLDRFQHWSVGYLAAMLAHMGPESAPVLRTALADTSRPLAIRAVIARTLAALKDVGSAELACEVLKSEPHVDLVVPVLGLIEKVGSRDHLSVVRDLLHSPEHAVRASAVSTLARIGTPEDTEHIRSALEDESNWVVLHAVRGLREMGETDFLAVVAASDHPGAIAAREILWGSPS